MQISLVRTDYASTYTLGLVAVPGLPNSLYSIEQPWANNAQGHSCIPDGTYQLIPYFSPKHDCWTWCMHNPELGIWATPDLITNGVTNGRSVCEIHSANWATQLEGCVALGQTAGILDGQEAVEDSKAAIQLFSHAMAPDGDIEHAVGHTLVISPAQGDGTSGYVYSIS